jgi:membrane-associated phospholipid phosphatase
MSVAVSRVLLGLHYLSDVLAGLVIGIGIGLLAVTFWAPSV